MKDKKKKKKKKPEVVELVQYQKPEVYQLVEEVPDVTHGHGGHGGIGGHHGGHHGIRPHIGGLHKKKYGRSIGGLFGRLGIRYSFWLWFLKKYSSITVTSRISKIIGRKRFWSVFFSAQ